MNRIKGLLAILVTICAVVGNVSAQTDTNTIYWIGNVSTDWNDVGNWSYIEDSVMTARIPDANSTVIFAGSPANNCVLDVNASITNVIFEDSIELDLDGYDFGVSGSIVMYDGVLRGSSSSIMVDGQVLLYGGDLYNTTDTLHVGQGFIDQNDVFRYINGTVHVTGDAYLEPYDFINKLVVDSGVTVSLGNNLLLISGVHNDGKIINGGYAVYLANDDTAAVTGSGGIYYYFPDGGEAGFLIWQVGESLGNFRFPFIPRLGGPVAPLDIDITTAGDGLDGQIWTVQIALDSFKLPNVFFPGFSFSKPDGSDNSAYTANRIWLTSYQGYDTAPAVDYVFNYTDEDLSGTQIVEANLQLQFWNGLNWQAPAGTVDTAANTITLSGIAGMEGYWALVDSSSPNYITPGVEVSIIDQHPLTGYSGSIELYPFGGDGSAGIEWWDASSANPRINLNSGSYAVSVIDGVPDTTELVIEVLYQVMWSDTDSVSAGPNYLISDHSNNAFNGTAASQNYLKANENGYFGFAGNNEDSETANFYIGLSSASQNGNNLEYSYQVSGNFINVYEGGQYKGNYGEYAGNVFAIGREGDTVRYYRNGSVVREIPASSGKSLAIYAGLGADPTQIDSIKASFAIPFGLGIETTQISATGGTGDIDLTIKGGESPFTVLWSDAATAEDRTALSAGTYTVTVTDDNSLTATATAQLGFGVVWTDTVDANTTATGLVKTTTSPNFDAGASSLNYLEAGTDGLAGFTVTNTSGAVLLFGLSEKDLDATEHTVEFGILQAGDQAIIVESGRNTGVSVTVSTNDVLKISRLGDSIYYYLNSALLRTVWTDDTEQMLIDVSLGEGEPTLDNVFASFGIPYGAKISVDNAWPTQYNSGSIVATPVGGQSPYTYIWSTGDTTASVSVEAGTYTATVTDDNNDTLVVETAVFNKIFWQGADDANVTGNSITKTTGSYGWDGGASSLNYLPDGEDGFVSFIVTSTEDQNQQFFIGLADTQSINYLKINYALQMKQGGLYIYESGQNKGFFGKLNIGDVPKVSCDGDSIRYYINNANIRSVHTSGGPLFIAASLGRNYPDIKLIDTDINDIFNPFIYYWVADTDSAWDNAANWSHYSGGNGGAGVPDTLSQVIFNSGSSMNCVLSDDIKVISVTMDSSFAAKLKLNGNVLSVDGNFILDGGSLVNGAGSLSIGGDLTQTWGVFEAGSDTITIAGTYEFNGGIFTGQTADVTVSGTLDLTGGAFTSTSNTLQLYSDFIDTNSVFVHNSGAVILHNYGVLNVGSSFSNLELADTIDVMLWDTLTIATSLTLNNSKLRMSGNPIYINSSNTTAVAASTLGGLVTSQSDFTEFVDWDVADGTGTYTLPFMTNSGEPTSITAVIDTAGSNDGHIVFATYATNANYYPVNNTPYASEDLGDEILASGIIHTYLIDRYWYVGQTGYSTLPSLSIAMEYTNADLEGANTINEDSLIIANWLVDSMYIEFSNADTLNAATNKVITASSNTFGEIFVLLDSGVQPIDAGTSCTEAILISDTLELRTFTMTDTVMWFKFEASDTTFYNLVKGIQQGYYIDSVELYSDTCGALVIKETYVNDSSFTAIFLSDTTLVISEYYYLKVYGDNGSYLRFDGSNRVGLVEIIPISSDAACGACFEVRLDAQGSLPSPAINSFEWVFFDRNNPSAPPLVFPRGAAREVFCFEIPAGNYWLQVNVLDNMGRVNGYYSFNSNLSPSSNPALLPTWPRTWLPVNSSGSAGSIDFTIVPSATQCAPASFDFQCTGCPPANSAGLGDAIEWTVTRGGVQIDRQALLARDGSSIFYSFSTTQIGTYTVSMTYYSEFCDPVIVAHDVIVEAPNFTSTITCPGGTPTVNFVATCPGAFTAWLFGDNGNNLGAIGDNVTHTYTTAGVYNVSMVVFSFNPSLSSITVVRPVNIAPLVTPVITTITGNLACGDQIYSAVPANIGTYNWDAGANGTVVSGQGNANATINWTNASGGIVTVTATNINGCTSTNTLSVAPCCPPDGLQIDGPTTSCGTGPVTYSVVDPSPGTNSYLWTVTGGTPTSGTGPDIDVTWGGTGPYTISVVSSSLCSNNSATVEVQECCGGVPESYLLFNRSISAITTLPNFNFTANGLPITIVNGVKTVTTNYTIYINGVLTIDENFAFQNCPRIFLGPDARIDVQPGVLLFIVGNNPQTHLLTAGCGEMWDGIYVKDGAALALQGYTVSLGINPVYVDGTPLGTGVGFNIFDRNNNHIIVNNCQSGQNVQVIYNDFTCTNTLIDPYPGGYTSTGIVIRNSKDVTIGINGVVSPLSNYFEDAGSAAIHMIRSSGIVSNNVFNGLPVNTPSGTARGVDVLRSNGANDVLVIGAPASSPTGTYNDFQNFNAHAVRVQNFNGNITVSSNLFAGSSGSAAASWCAILAANCTTANKSSLISIENNVIKNGSIGVQLRFNTNKSLVRNNNIGLSTQASWNRMGIQLLNQNPGQVDPAAVNRDNILSNIISNAHTGIHVGSRPSVNVINNLISIDDDPTFLGFGVNMVNSHNSLVRCNEITGSGTSSSGSLFGIRSDGSGKIDLFCNETNNLGRGLSFHRSNFLTQAFDNDFGNCNVGIGFQQGANIGDQGDSYRTSDNQWLGTYSNTIRNFGFIPVTKFHMRDNTSSTYDASSSTFGLFPIWDDIRTEPILSNTAYQVVPCSTSRCIGAKSAINQAPALLFLQGVVAFEEDSLVYRWWARFDLYNAMLQEDTLLNADTLFASFASEFEQSSTYQLLNIGDEISILDTLNGTDYELVVGRLNGIPIDNDLDENLKGFFRLEMDRLYEPGEVDYNSELWELAEQCAFYGGPAVLIARNILSADSLELIYYPWDSLCTSMKMGPDEEERMVQNQLEVIVETQYRLVPNFFGNDKTGQIMLGTDEKGQLEIYSIDGRLVGEYALSAGKNTLGLNKALIQNGVYIYKIFVDGQLETTDRLVYLE